MGKYGFHAGKGVMKSGKVGGKFIYNQEVINYQDFDIDFIWTSSTRGEPLRDYLGFGPCSIPVYDFFKGADSIEQAVGYSTIVPTGIPENARAQVRLYWTLSGVNADAGDTAHAVVWDVDYIATSVMLSGTHAQMNSPAAGDPFLRDYTVSGTWSNATTTSSYHFGKWVNLSGALNETIVSLPKRAFKGGDLLRFEIFRDINETADTVDEGGAVMSICAVLEYVD